MTVTTETKVRWTSADLELMPDDGCRREIIDGELYVIRAPHWNHQRIITRMLRALSNWVADHQQGEVITTPGLIFADEDNVIPDLVWVSDEKIATSINQSGHLTAAPELAVEVLSQTPKDVDRDRQAKLKLYSRVGVHEYWIIDWQKQEIEIYRRSQARLQLVCTLFSEDTLTSPLFPEFSLQVAQIFS